MAFDIDMIKKAVYAKLPQRIAQARQLVGKPLTLVEKITIHSSMEWSSR